MIFFGLSSIFPPKVNNLTGSLFKFKKVVSMPIWIFGTNWFDLTYQRPSRNTSHNSGAKQSMMFTFCHLAEPLFQDHATFDFKKPLATCSTWAIPIATIMYHTSYCWKHNKECVAVHNLSCFHYVWAFTMLFIGQQGTVF